MKLEVSHMEDSNFSESHEDFIILPSQEESQMFNMTEAVCNLPALQDKAFPDDMEEIDTEVDDQILTPAEHLGSLQLSQHPMIVPDTQDDADNIIPPSPEAYGSTPMIIPGSPTQGEEDEDEMETDCKDEEYDVTIMNTFQDNPTNKNVCTPVKLDEKVPAINKSLSSIENQREENTQSKEISSKEIQEDLEMPTLVNEEMSESLHLHFTESTQASHLSANRDVQIDLTSSVEILHEKDKSYETEAIFSEVEQATEKEENFNKVEQEATEKEEIFNEGEQATEEEVIFNEVEQATEKERIFVEVEQATEEEVIFDEVKQATEEEVIVIPSDNGNVEDSQNISLHLTQSQSIPANSQKSVGQRSHVEQSQGQNESSQSSRTQEEKVRSRRQSREERHLAANPVVIWKDESDTDKFYEAVTSRVISPVKFLGFHLSVPTGTPTEPPEPKISEHYSPLTDVNEEDQKSDNDNIEDIGDRQDESRNDDSVVEVDDEVSIRRALTITMVHSDSEESSQTLFKLERPTFDGGTEDITNDTEDMFARKKVANPKVIQEDSEDGGEEVGCSMKTNYDTSEEVFIARKMSSDNLDEVHQLEENTETYEPEKKVDNGHDSQLADDVVVDKVFNISSEPVLMDKGDAFLKSPIPDKRECSVKKITTPSRRNSLEKRPAISPDETKHIVDIYSNILAKSQRRRKSGESRNMDDRFPSSQKPNPLLGSLYESRKLQPRRLSVQSLPADVTKSCDVTFSPKKQEPRISCSGGFLPVLSPSEAGTNKTMTNVIQELSQPTTDQNKGTHKTPACVEGIASEINSPNKQSKTEELDIDLREIELDARSRLRLNRNLIDGVCSKDSKKTYTSVNTTKESSSVTRTAKPADQCHVTLSSQLSQRTENLNFSQNMSPSVKLTNISKLFENKPHIILQKEPSSMKTRRSSQTLSKLRQKKRKKSASERNSLHSSRSSPSSQETSGMFTNSTQKFQTKKSSTSPDPFMFHATQSQKAPEDKKQRDRSIRTDALSRKRKLLHRKSGLKKQHCSPDTASKLKHHVAIKARSPTSEAGQTLSQQTDVTTTSSGSMPSIPSSISLHSPCLEPILSPSGSSSGRQSVAEEITTRLSGKRLSIDQSLLETITTHDNEDNNYTKVTIVTETIEKLHREITTIRKVVSADGVVLEETVDVKKKDPITVQENTHKLVQYIYVPSPSRSITSLTSGDLADVSSSLSKSSVSSNSLGSKVSLVSSTSASLEHEERNDLVSSKKSVDTQIHPQKSVELASAEQVTPSFPARTRSTWITPAIPARNQSKPATPAIPSTTAHISDHDASDVVTPLGSTIDKTGSRLYERTSSAEESPKVSESIFSSSGGKRKKSTRSTRQTEHNSVEEENINEDNSAHEVNRSKIPHQHQNTDSSSEGEGGDNLLSSSGTVGSRVIAKWKDGFYYPGTMKSSTNSSSKCSIKFDDGDSMSVKTTDILLIERLPAGQSVMVLTDEGDFECGLILKQNTDNYKVETDAGTCRSYTLSQVILSADQASFLIADRGNEITMQLPGQTVTSGNKGNVSLDNLVDTPRRGAAKIEVPNKTKEERTIEQGTSSRSRKRKIDVLQPQATSTPTPKGKSEGITKRRKVESPYDTSPIKTPNEAQVSVKRSPKKTTKIGLFPKENGPLPTKKIFKGMNFLLTNVVRSKDQLDQDKSFLLGSSLDTSTDESSTEDDLNPPFDKDHLKAQIETGGGNVVEDIDDKVLKGKKKCVLISSTYQRTIKYLQCLAAGLPCVSHLLVVDSCTQNRLLDEKSYTLPAGISLEKRKLTEWKAKDDVFIGVKAVVQSKDSTFVEAWTNILQLSKCHVHKQLQFTDTHVIVADKTCSSSIERQARNKNIPLVSTEWIIQSLINGKVANFEGHPQYKHDFKMS